MRLRIAGYEESATTTYYTLRKRLYSRYGKRLFLTNDRNHGGIAEFSNLESLVWNDAYWRRPSQWFATCVWRLETLEHKRKSHDWNHVLESLCSLERKGSGQVPVRSVSRRIRLNRGWTRVN
jgi:hypothetical protein